MRLRDLHSFVVVAEEGNFTRAARRLHIAQPPLSYRIQQLESRLEVQLFDRTTRSVTLTAAGQVFMAKIKPVLTAFEEAKQASKRTQSGEIGVLRLGYTGRASQEYLPKLLSRFRRQNPNVTIDLQGPKPTGSLTADVLDNQLDAALCFLPTESSRLASRLLFESEFSLVLSSAHTYADRTVADLADFREEPFIAYPSGAGFHLRRATDQICLDAGFVPQVVRETEASQTLLCLVAAGIGVSIIPQDVKTLSMAGVVYKPISHNTYHLQHGLVWLRENPNPVIGRLLKAA